ncbi:methylated-DNA--[protein]-cysteine S-methyltransferase [Actinocrispum sp. NPDC049592]|uniref:methylated-DNA--[protein]-cysteine S-methyltransferase n=1 Tax=Actinocrispum sp. NPDC049592 TaxID=3154835 RepID=UPI0034253CDD
MKFPDVDPRTVTRLRDRLAAEADREGVLDIAYRTVDTPVGSLMLVATEQGLLRVVFEREGHEAVLEHIADVVSPRILQAAKRLDEPWRQLDEYFAGDRRRFELPLDLRLAKGFRRTVLDHLPDIAYGQTWSYAQVAAAAGSPRAVRAVGSACATNPIPIVVPCHRVVRSDGTYGEYVGSPENKVRLLTMEAA